MRGETFPSSFLLPLPFSAFGFNCSKVQPRGFLSGRQRRNLLPWRKRPPETGLWLTTCGCATRQDECGAAGRQTTMPSEKITISPSEQTHDEPDRTRRRPTRGNTGPAAARLGLHEHLIVMPEDEAAETVPLWLVEPTGAAGNFGYRFGFCRGIRRLNGQRNARK